MERNIAIKAKTPAIIGQVVDTSGLGSMEGTKYWCSMPAKAVELTCATLEFIL